MLHPGSFVLSVSLALATALQSPMPAQVQAPDGFHDAAGVTLVEGAPHAFGPDWRARFDDRGVEFTPALGRRAATPQTLRYELESVRRGAVTWFERGTAPCAPAADGNRVVYHHAPGLDETYEARRDGLEQTFGFAERPQGTGDLVVRGRVSTPLPLQHACERDGLRYFADGIGGVTVGGVTGIDHNGARIAGTVRLVGDDLELTLPAAFVDSAAYPLVLDPLLAAAFPIGDQPGTDLLPSVAFDESTQRYYVAWVVEAANGHELRGQLLTAAGAPIGSPQVLSTDPSLTEPPVVVNVAAMNRFLVVIPTQYVQAMWIRCVAVSASTGSVSNSVTIFGIAGYASKVAAGGDARANGNTVLVAYTGKVTIGSTTYETVRRLFVQVPSGGDPILGSTFEIETVPITATPTFGKVAITRSCGTAGRWLVCWRNFKSVRCLAISEAGNWCTPITTVYTAGLFNGILDLACATRDGNDFAVAWHETSLLVPPRLRMAPIDLFGVCPATIALGPVVTPVADTGGARTFALDFARHDYLLAWSQIAGGSQQVFVKDLDPTTCVDCGIAHAVEPAVTSQDQPALASRWSSGDTASDEALVVWTDGTIRGRRAEARGNGTVVNVGGGCGNGGGNVPGHQGAPVLGDLSFALTLSQPTAPTLGAILGLSQVGFACGPCTLVPNSDAVLGGPGPHAIPLPCDLSYLGLQFWAQWVLWTPGGCPLTPDYALSDAQRFTIGE